MGYMRLLGKTQNKFGFWQRASREVIYAFFINEGGSLLTACRAALGAQSTTPPATAFFRMEQRMKPYDTVLQIKIPNHVFASKMA